MATASPRPNANNRSRVRVDVISKFSHKHSFRRSMSRRRHHETTLRMDQRFAEKFHHGVNRVYMRRRDADDAAEFAHRTNERIRLDRSPGFDVL